MIYDRGGKRRISQLVDVFSVKWSRVLDDRSTATVALTSQSCRNQLDTVTGIEPLRHELVIYRGADRVWEGPIGEVAWFSNRVEIVASDVTQYAAGTPLSRDWPNSESGGPVYMTERVQQILEHELSVPYTMETNAGTVVVDRFENISPPANVLPHLEVRPSVGPGGIRTFAVTEAFQMNVLDHLNALSRGGLDYTAVGRRLLIWDSASSIGRTRILTESDFYGELRVYASGADFAAISHISAESQDPDAPPAVGHAGAPDPYYGPWERVVSLTSEEGGDAPTQVELNGQAARDLVGRNPVPTQIVVPKDAGLRLRSGLTVDQLIPGVVMPVRATLNLRLVSQDQRLESVTVTETGAGEVINVTLFPAGNLEAA